MKKDLENIEDIQMMVNTFYTRIQGDDLLGSIFNKRIQDRWDTHLEKMYRFWQTVLFEEHTYFGSPFPPHASMPISAIHFQRWVEIFIRNIEENFQGNKTDEAIWRAKKMAELFESKIALLKNNKQIPLI